MNPTILSPAMCKYKRQVAIFNFGMAKGLELKFRIQTNCTREEKVA